VVAVALQMYAGVGDTGNGSGASIGGVGLVLILGLGLIVLGIVFMLWQRAGDGAYFRGETLVEDTPALIVEEP
jgi:hypothetical protein